MNPPNEAEEAYLPIKKEKTSKQIFFEKNKASDLEIKRDGFDISKRGLYYSASTFFSKKRLENFELKRRSTKNKFTQVDIDKQKPKKSHSKKKTDGSEEFEEEDLKTKRRLKEMLFFGIYLIFLTTVALSMVSSSRYFFANVTETLFFDTDFNAFTSEPKLNNSLRKTLRTAKTLDDFWHFAETTLIHLFYRNFNYSDPSLVTNLRENATKMLEENLILGVPRMRQLRVTNDSCEIHPDIEELFDSCYSYYSVFAEETNPIRDDMEDSLTATAWVYTEASILNTSLFVGEISVYGGGGYYLDLSTDVNISTEMIAELKKNHWLSGATRAIFIDFNLYNANTNMFCICKIFLEFPPVGGIIPRANFYPLKFIRYLNAFDFFILACEIILGLFIAYFTYLIIVALKNQKMKFFTSWLNILDVGIILFSYCWIIMSIIRSICVQNLLKTVAARYPAYTEFDFIKDMQIHFDNLIAIIVFLAWCKIFLYLDFSVTLLEFRRTLAKSFAGVLWFLPMFIAIFFAFVLLAYLLFGNQLKDYRTLWFSSLGLLQAFLGGFQYAEILDHSRILGPLFYIAFTFFIFFIFLNVFFAIINDAYATVKSEVTTTAPRTGEYTIRGIKNVFTCCRPQKLKNKAALKKSIMFEELRKALQNAGFSKTEINIFFKKYDINVNTVFDNTTRRKVMEDLEIKRTDYSDVQNMNEITILRKQNQNLRERIDDLESNLQPLMDKVDILLDNLGTKKLS